MDVRPWAVPLDAGSRATSVVRIAIVGDFDPGHETHPATATAVGHASEHRGAPTEVVWIPTPDLDGHAARLLTGFGGIWIAPGSPYASMQGALDAITFARTGRVPLLGTSAGFQHIVLEHGRNVLGIHDAAHAESDPGAPTLMIDALACSLAGQTFTVELAPGSRAAAAYATPNADERYYCSFGLNPAFVEPLAAAGLRVTGTDLDGEPRIVEFGHVRPVPGRHPLRAADAQRTRRAAPARAELRGRRDRRDPPVRRTGLSSGCDGPRAGAAAGGRPISR